MQKTEPYVLLIVLECRPLVRLVFGAQDGCVIVSVYSNAVPFQRPAWYSGYGGPKCKRQ